MAFNEADIELRDILSHATDEELDPILDCILGKDRDGRLGSSLDMDEEYKAHPKEPSRYWKKVGEEIQLYGGHTMANVLRGHGVTYHEILVDVAKRVGVKFNKNSPSESIEVLLVQKIFEDAWERLSPADREKFIREAGLNGVVNVLSPGPIVTVAILSVLKVGGFATYKFMVIIVHSVWRFLFGYGLPFMASPILTKGMSVFIGPIGWAIACGWVAFDLLGPAFRVTVPAVLQIALIRQSHAYRKAECR